jgi:heat shock protein HslJ
MPDTPDAGGNEADETPDTTEHKGYMVSLAVILIGILIVMVVFMNLWGQSATAATAITENPWSLESVGNADGSLTPAATGPGINVSFALDGTFTGYGGCSRYSGRYMIQATKTVTSRVTTASPACTDQSALLQEQQYFMALENAAALRVHERVLTLYDTGGKTLLVFGPARVQS